MVGIAKGSHLLWPSRRQVALRRARIRDSWSPWERRERAREAKAQSRFLLELIEHADHLRVEEP
jgi:hypothetical protein